MPSPSPSSGAVSLFDGLAPDALAAARARMRRRRVGAGEAICRQGEPGHSLYVIERGLAHVTLERADGRAPLARLRAGDVVGEMALITGEPRTATVTAILPTDVWELDRDAFAALLAERPALMGNLVRILSHRLARTSARQVPRRRGEAVGLVLSPRAAALASDVVLATRRAAMRPVAALDCAGRAGGDAPDAMDVEDALGALEELLPAHGTVLVTVDADHEALPLLWDQLDRVVLLGRADDARRVRERLGARRDRAELGDLALLDGPDAGASDTATVDGFRLVRRVDARAPAADVAWLGRHLARTKIGLALGAGGAKGWAHVGVLHALERAGHVVDCVSGSSVGAVIASLVALGRDAAGVEAALRAVFTPETVDDLFEVSWAGTTESQALMARLAREATEGRTFAETRVPLTLMTADLESRLPVPLADGPIWEAIVAATALAPILPPVPRGGMRLIDGIALVPVPVESLHAMGADVTVAVNILSRETTPAWPGMEPPPPRDPDAVRLLDTLLETIDLTHLDASVRHAAAADVVVTPCFGPGTWKDFHLGDLFLAAGREAAERALPALGALARPAG